MTQITRQNLLVASACAGLWIVCFPCGAALYDDWLPIEVTKILVFPHWFVMIGAPFAAVGALFGKVEIGIWIGLAVAVVLMLPPLLYR